MLSFLARSAFGAALLIPVAAFAADERTLTPVNTDPMLAPAGKYNFQGSHTGVVFNIMHLGLTSYYGRINKASGSIDFNPQNPEKSSVTVEVAMKDLDTPYFSGAGKKPLDERICAADAFDCAQFPSATFKSNSVKVTGKNTGDITGTLTLHGVTKPVVLHTTFNAGRKSPFGGDNYMLGFSASAMIKRSDFDLNKMSWGGDLSDEVNLLIQAELSQAAAPAAN